MITEYDSNKIQAPALDELLEIWRYRDLLRLLVANRIKTRYKRSALGVVWTLLNPLLNTFVLTIAFSSLFRFDLVNYPVYILVGLLFWNFFSQTTMDAMNTLIWGSSLLKRVYLPRTIFAISVVGISLVNFFLALIPLVIIMLVLRHPIRPIILLLPVAILLMSLFTLGISLVVSTLAVFFVDVVDIYGVLISALFFLTPVIYPISIIPEGLLRFLSLNPMIPMLNLFRSLIYLGQLPSGTTWAASIVISLASITLGWWIFTKRVDEFAYRI